MTTVDSTCFSSRFQSLRAEIFARYADGESIKAISASTKIHHSIISRALHAANIHVRIGAVTHGATSTTEYGIWKGLQRRRSNGSCAAWHSFKAWLEDVGPRVGNLKFARIDKLRPYACGICPDCIANNWTRNGAWMTHVDACRGSVRATWIEHDGKRQTLADWARDTGIHHMTLFRRLSAGWPIERALTTAPDSAANQPDLTALNSTSTIDLTGQKFGLLTVISFAGHRKRNILQWHCLCECGRKTIITSASLRSGTTKSCGCLVARLDSEGRRPNVRHPLYMTWHQMLRRCIKDADYAGRGIAVCQRWRSFHDFIADMGERPEGFSLERIDNNGNYSCGQCEQCRSNKWSRNCVWADRWTQSRNRRTTRFITAFGATKTLSEWTVLSGNDRRCIDKRIRRGWSAEDAIFTPAIIPKN